MEAVRHERLLLKGGGQLAGRLVAQHLGKARQNCRAAVQPGDFLERLSEEMMSESPVYSLAIDGVGSAAVEALANAACRRLEDEAAARGGRPPSRLARG